MFLHFRRARALTPLAFFFFSLFLLIEVVVWRVCECVCSGWLLLVASLCVCVWFGWNFVDICCYVVYTVYTCITIFLIVHRNILRSVLSSSWQILKSPQS